MKTFQKQSKYFQTKNLFLFNVESNINHCGWASVELEGQKIVTKSNMDHLKSPYLQPWMS